MKANKLIIFFILCLLLVSCADVSHVEACVSGSPYGFWAGIWHGSITFFSFIGSLFSNDIAIYAVNNVGPLYDLGFILGWFGLVKGIVFIAELIVEIAG